MKAYPDVYRTIGGERVRVLDLKRPMPFILTQDDIDKACAHRKVVGGGERRRDELPGARDAARRRERGRGQVEEERRREARASCIAQL